MGLLKSLLFVHYETSSHKQPTFYLLYLISKSINHGRTVQLSASDINQLSGLLYLTNVGQIYQSTTIKYFVNGKRLIMFTIQLFFPLLPEEEKYP